MATKPDFAAFVHEQLGGEKRGITRRKMFGEYGLHCYGKFFALICDDMLFFKPTPEGEKVLRERGEVIMAPPYDGAKDYFQIDSLDDTELLSALVNATVDALPEPTPKKTKTKATK